MPATVRPPLPDGEGLDEDDLPPCPECGEGLAFAVVEVWEIDWAGGRR